MRGHLSRRDVLKGAVVVAAGALGLIGERALGDPPPGKGWRKTTTRSTTATTATTPSTTVPTTTTSPAFTVSISGIPQDGQTLTAVVQ